VSFGLRAEDDLHVGEAEIGVDDEHALATLGGEHRQVRGQHGLAHPTLATRHRHHPKGLDRGDTHGLATRDSQS